MADNKSVDDVQYDDDGNPITTDKKSENEGDDKSKDSDKKEDKTTDKEGEEEDKGEPDKDENTFDDTATPSIPVRKSNAQFIIERKNRKIEKLQSKDKTEDTSETDDIDTDTDSDSNLSEDASKAIDSAVDSRIKPVVELLISKANEEELKDLFSAEPDAKKYENHIKAYLQHDAYKNVPPDVIYHHLAFNNALAIGAKKRSVADKEANLNKSGGRGLPPKESVSGLPSPEDIADMTDEEFAKMEEDARQGKFIKK